ncbi:MAG: peroxiredoxin [Geodermatophilaceae bacterium]
MHRGELPVPGRAAEFEAVGAARIGISADTVDKQKEFSDTHSFDYPLLSDTDREVATAYGVRRRFVTPVKRATFVINADGRIAEVITGEFNMDIHADEALESLPAAPTTRPSQVLLD